MQTFACTKGVARKAYASSEILFFEEFEIEFLSERSIGNFYFATQSFTNDCRNMKSITVKLALHVRLSFSNYSI